MKIVEVAASTKSYNVYIGAGLLACAAEYIRAIAPKVEKIALITDDTVDALHADTVKAALESAGYNIIKYVLPHGEESKNGSNYLAILSHLAENQLTRSDLLVALGGGMVGDIAAFSAATYLRGIKYVQMPTTLLAMVDSSVGGKTAIDLPAGKNLAGAFCQPDAVLIDTNTLSTLPEDILRDGCAEVLKYGILGDRELFDHLVAKGLGFDREYVIWKSVSMKRDYVCADEFDTGVRRKLNLGHTLGHAVEKLSDFGLSHGKSVAIGTASVARAAAADGHCSAQCAAEIESGLARLGLPTKTDMNIESLMLPMLSDKKRAGSLVNVIVPERIGFCGIVPMDADKLREFMNKGL